MNPHLSSDLEHTHPHLWERTPICHLSATFCVVENTARAMIFPPSLCMRSYITRITYHVSRLSSSALRFLHALTPADLRPISQLLSYAKENCYGRLSRWGQSADLGRYQAGPRCAMVLADLGAEVMKVEEPGGDESRGLDVYWSAYNRGKKSITLNLQRARQAVLRALVPKATCCCRTFALSDGRDGLWLQHAQAKQPRHYSHQRLRFL